MNKMTNTRLYTDVCSIKSKVKSSLCFRKPKDDRDLLVRKFYLILDDFQIWKSRSSNLTRIHIFQTLHAPA